VKILQGVFLVFISVVLSVGSLIMASAFKWSQELPDLSALDELEFTSTSQIFARDGQLIGEIVPLGRDGANTDRIPVGLDEVSPAVIAAIQASEDDSFYRHYGFDPRAILYASYLELTGQGGRGGSGLTIQLAKNVFFSDIATERTLERKVKELMVAIELERRYTKAEIMQRYINEVPWGFNLHGVHSAAKAYFDKHPSELNLAEGLYLARLLPAPSITYNNFAATRRAMRGVLDNMVARGYVSAAAAERAWRYDLQPRGWRVQYDEEGNVVGEPERTDERIRVATSVSSDLAPHVSYVVRNELSQRFGNSVIFGSGGLRVYTTIDVQAQEAANRASLNAEVPPGAQLAIVGLEPETGEILAMVGEKLVPGRSAGETLNRATGSYRQPGSSFKPIVYATAIETAGYTQASVLVDEPITIPVRDQPDWQPQNYYERFYGMQTLREHLNQSYNIPVAKLIMAVTPEAVLMRAQELGYGANIRPYPSMALGVFEVTPLQHASAFGAFANGGVWVEPQLISRIEDADGNVLWRAPRRETRVWSEQTAYVMLDMLHATVTEGIGARAAIEDRWVAGKTGTSQRDRDLWFVGITPGMTAAVWIGRDDDTPLVRADGSRVTSSLEPAVIWRQFAEHALRGVPPREFAVPEGIEFYAINRETGLAADANSARVAFVSGTGPNTSASLLARTPQGISIPVDRTTGRRATAETDRSHVEWRQIDPGEIDRYQ
jgi:membrane peptidoglycan carboxypeptidase